MRETNKARQAFEDYFLLGPGRSLTSLLRCYQNVTEVIPPTRRIGTLKKWSTEFGWQDRVLQRETEIATAQFEAIKKKAVESGYAYWPKRVQDLIALAELLLGEINTENKRWLPDVKQIGSGYMAEKVEIVRFNSALIEQFRRTLDDIASEVGERAQKLELGAIDGKPLTLRVIYGNDDLPEKAT